MYAATLSRPDIMFSVCKLSRYLNEPTMAHMTQAKRVLTYLETTSTTGWVFMYNGGAISWRSHQQGIILLRLVLARLNI